MIIGTMFMWMFLSIGDPFCECLRIPVLLYAVPSTSLGLIRSRLFFPKSIRVHKQHIIYNIQYTIYTIYYIISTIYFVMLMHTVQYLTYRLLMPPPKGPSNSGRLPGSRCALALKAGLGEGEQPLLPREPSTASLRNIP